MVQQEVIMPAIFATTNIPEQKKLSNSASFPAVLHPAQPDDSGKESLLRDLLERPSNRVLLEKLLAESGAVLIRGFELNDAEDFNDVMERIGWEDFPYSVGGEATRHKVVGKVFTANDGVPLDKPIGFHNEVAYLPNSPSKIIFFCDNPAPEDAGGCTLIAHGRTVYEKLVECGHKKFLEELSEKGVRYSKLLAEEGHGSWKSMFQTEDKLEAEKRASKVGSSIKWLPNGQALFLSNPCAGVKINPVTGDKVWYNTIAGIQVYKAMTPPGSFDALYGDGTPFPDQAIRDCLRILDEEKVAFSWQKGDLLILDNLTVLHARQPTRFNCPRTILVSLCK